MPSASLPAHPGGEPLDLRPSRGPRVFVSLHSSGCDECIGYAKEIMSVRDQVRAWGADILMVSSDASRAIHPALSPFDLPVVEDRERILADGRLEVVITDEWGEVYFASNGEGAHSPVSPEEVIEWVKFVAIQCPECEGPEGKWRDL